jgi:hypothetical protein
MDFRILNRFSVILTWKTKWKKGKQCWAHFQPEVVAQRRSGLPSLVARGRKKPTMPTKPPRETLPRPAYGCRRGRARTRRGHRDDGQCGGTDTCGELNLEEEDGGHREHLGARPIRRARWWRENLTGGDGPLRGGSAAEEPRHSGFDGGPGGRWWHRRGPVEEAEEEEVRRA